MRTINRPTLTLILLAFAGCNTPITHEARAHLTFAEQGSLGAMHQMAWLYQHGKGVPQNDTLAVSWYQKAAREGFIPAMTDLGWMYENGRGVRQNYAEALTWYRKVIDDAAQLKEPDSNWIFTNRKFEHQSFQESLDWYTSVSYTQLTLPTKA